MDCSLYWWADCNVEREVWGDLLKKKPNIEIWQLRYVAKDEFWYYQSKLAVEYSRRNQTGENHDNPGYQEQHQTNRDAEIINIHLGMKQ